MKSNEKTARIAFETALAFVPSKLLIPSTPVHNIAIAHTRRNTGSAHEGSDEQEGSVKVRIRENASDVSMDTLPNALGTLVGEGTIGQIVNLIGTGNDIFGLIFGESSILINLFRHAGKFKGVVSKEKPKNFREMLLATVAPKALKIRKINEKYDTRDIPFSTQRDIYRLHLAGEVNFLLNLNLKEFSLLFNHLPPEKQEKIKRTIEKIGHGKEYEQTVSELLEYNLLPIFGLPVLPEKGYDKKKSSLYVADGLVTAEFIDTSEGRARIPSDVGIILKDVEDGFYGEILQARLKNFIQEQKKIFIENAPSEIMLRAIAYELASKYSMQEAITKGLLDSILPLTLKLAGFLIEYILVMKNSIAPKILLDSFDFLTDAYIGYTLYSFARKLDNGLLRRSANKTIANYLKSDTALIGLEEYIDKNLEIMHEEQKQISSKLKRISRKR